MRQGAGPEKRQQEKRHRACKRGGIWIDPTCFPHLEKMR